MSGEVGHFEMPADNPERARRFYTATFGWRMSPIPGMDYTMVHTGATDEKGMATKPGYISGGIAKRGAPIEHPVVTIVVDDLVAATKAVEKNGGKVIQPKQEIPGNMGWSAYIRDTEGNVVGLYQSPRAP
jgi:uncharacterized protein